MGHMYVCIYIYILLHWKFGSTLPESQMGSRKKMKTVETKICLKELSGGSMRIWIHRVKDLGFGLNPKPFGD